MDKESARQAIADLVEKYRQTPQPEEYNEQETRLAFILPLFQILGWDIHNPMEMSAEEQISRGRVDFGFYLRGLPMFYVETKRIHEKINRLEWGQQAINYAWLRDVTWTVLTDFRHLRVFNAEVLESVPERAIFLKMEWENYATSDFEKLWLLSKASWQARELDKLADEWNWKAKKEPVTRLLFAQMTIWRRDIFKEMQSWGKNPTPTVPLASEGMAFNQIDEAIQRLLDRLIFIRTMEDRLVEEPRLQALLRQYHDSRKKNKNLFKELLKLFRELDGVYNARLFAPHTLDMLEFHNEILLGSLIDGLYNAPSGYGRYDFSSINADVLGSIYEQYLRFKVIDPRGTQALEVVNGNGHTNGKNGQNGKQGKRKLQGIYYTPQYVVRYIVQNTLGKVLESGVDPYQVRVLDPACGSGAFLIEAFDVLDRWLAEHGTPEDQANPRQRRLKILQNNLYGVDLDPQAIEVAQLNLLIRAAHERGKLPMLEHLRDGNSLIDEVGIAGELAFNWSAQFPEVMNEGGFDVVVGNPPYIPMEYMQPAEKAYYQKTYPQLKRKYDSSVIFILAGLQKLLKPTGRLGFISSITWQTGENYDQVRAYIFENGGIDTLINLPFDVFEDAYVDTGIYLLTKQPQDSYQIYVFPKKTANPDLKDLPYQVVEKGMINTSNYKVVLEPSVYSVLKQIRETVPHQDLGAITISTQGLSASNFIQHASRTESEWYPFMTEGQAHRYELLIQEQAYVDLSNHPSLKRFYEAEPKLLIRRIVSRQDRLLVGYTDQKMLFTKDINPFIPRQTSLSPLYLLGILNSKLISYLYVHSSSIATKDDFRQTTLSELRQLPIPTINFENESQSKQHQQMVEWVQQMLALRPKFTLADAQKTDKRHDLARQIQQLEKQIDQLVYQLYKLSNVQIETLESYFQD